MTTTMSAPALNIISASSPAPSMVLRSATMGTSGNSARMASTQRSPSARISGVPASSQSTPARTAARANSMASSIEVTSIDTWMIGFMRNPLLWGLVIWE